GPAGGGAVISPRPRERLGRGGEGGACFRVAAGGVSAAHRPAPPAPAGAPAASRFPADPALLRRVSAAIAERLEDLSATVGYCSAACGSDILFAERMLERGAELHVVLPYHEDDFRYTSVDYGLDHIAAPPPPSPPRLP